MNVTQAVAEILGVEVTKEQARSIAKMMESKVPRKGRKLFYVAPYCYGGKISALLHTTEDKFFFYEGIKEEKGNN
jgi:hypothetical protein